MINKSGRIKLYTRFNFIHHHLIVKTKQSVSLQSATKGVCFPLLYICLFIQLTHTNGLMKFIVLFQQLSMRHIYNDIFHQAAVSQSFSNIRLNITSFIFTLHTGGPRRPSYTEFQQNLEDK